MMCGQAETQVEVNSPISMTHGPSTSSHEDDKASPCTELFIYKEAQASILSSGISTPSPQLSGKFSPPNTTDASDKH